MSEIVFLQTQLGIKSFNKLTDGDDYWQALLWFDEDKFGGAGDDEMYGNVGNDDLAGGSGEDYISGGGGDDNLFGGDNDDFLVGGAGFDQLFGDGGNDTLISGFADATLVIDAATDALFDRGGVMDGGTGNDQLYVDVFLNGALAVDGGADTDRIDYSFQHHVWRNEPPASLPTNLLDLESGIGETPFGGRITVARIENVTGSEYRDEFYGDNFANVIQGLGNKDVLEGRGGADTLDGGAGYDVAQYTSASSGVDVDMARTAQAFTIARNNQIVGNGDAAGDVLISIEELRGSNFDDVLRGKSGGGLPSNETFKGGNGNDVIEGRFGADTIDGGSGIDVASYESSAGVSVSLARPGFTGTAQLGDAAGDTLVSIENLWGSAFADTFVGNDDGNELRGNAGADTLSGLGGADFINGGAGMDTIVGGMGRDSMIGGSESDTFKFFNVLESNGNVLQRDLVRDFERDTITIDFSGRARAGAGDTLDFSAIDADARASASGNQAFAFIGSQEFTAAGQLRVVTGFDTAGNPLSLVQLEVNGDGIADMQISVITTNGTLLGASDFIF